MRSDVAPSFYPATIGVWSSVRSQADRWSAARRTAVLQRRWLDLSRRAANGAVRCCSQHAKLFRTARVCSPRASNVGGTVKSSALAILRLIFRPAPLEPIEQSVVEIEAEPESSVTRLDSLRRRRSGDDESGGSGAS